MKTIPFNFFRFHVVKTYFKGFLYSGKWKLIFRLVETVCFYSEFFSDVGNHYWNLGEPILKHFPANGNHFLWFSCQKKQFFCIVETYFSINASFRVMKTDFLASTNHFLYFFRNSCRGKLLFLSSGTYSWKNPSFRLWRRIFLPNGDRYFTWKFFCNSENRDDWKSVVKD